MRIATLFAAAGLAVLASSAAAQQRPDVPAAALGLPQVLQAARGHVDVLLARQLQSAAESDVLAADHRPAPVLSAKAASIDLQNGIGPGNPLQKRIDKSIGVDWTLERGGKRELRTEAARRAADAAQLDVLDATLRQQQAAASGFYDLLAAQQRLREVEQLARHAADLSAAGQRRQRAGDISQQEALRTEIESRRADAELRSAQADQDKAAVQLAQLTGLALPLRVQADWPEAAELGAALPDVDQRPEVRAAQRRVDAAEVAFQSALALRRNDVTVGASYDHYPGTSNRLLEFRVQMPLAGLFGNYGYEGEIGRARVQLEQARTQLDKARLLARTDDARLRTDIDAAAARSREFSGAIVPRARQVSDMAELAYSRGAMSVTELIDARRTLRAVLLDEIAVRADYARALAAWRLRQGANLDRP